MARPPGRNGPGWYPRPEWLVALVIAAALLLAGGAVLRSRLAGGDHGSAVRVARDTATPSPTPVATAIPTATPTPSPTPPPTPTATPAPSVTLRPDTVGNGDTLLVVVQAPAGDTGSVLFAGESLPLSRDGADLWAVVGVPLGTTAGPGTLTVALRDASGATAGSANATYTVTHIDRPIDNLTLTPSEASILTPAAGAREAQLRDEQFSRFDRGRRWSGLFRWPVVGPITTLFGQGRRINGGPPGDFHSGTDIAADEGTPVLAAAPGRVAWTGLMPIRGNTIVIDHGAGVMTSYSHLSEIDVKVDQIVAEGEPIGKVGHTGLATGPHLHWELLIYGTDVDATEWTRTDFTPPGVEPVATSSPSPTPAATSTAAPTATEAPSATPAASPTPAP